MIKQAVTSISGKERREMTVTLIANQLLQRFMTHIGKDHAISRDMLFRQLYKHPYSDNDLADYLRWDFTKRAMHYCRKYTKCFIACENRHGEFYFFVLKDNEDANVYIARLHQSIRQMHTMMKRAQKAVDDKWYHERWELPNAAKLLNKTVAIK